MQRKEFFDLLEIMQMLEFLHYSIRQPVQFECERVIVHDKPDGQRGIPLSYRPSTWYAYHLLSGDIENHGQHEPNFYNRDVVLICSEQKNEEVESFLTALRNDWKYK